MQLHIKCAVLKNLCFSDEKTTQFKILSFLVVQGCQNVNSSKNGGFRYEMIGET